MSLRDLLVDAQKILACSESLKYSLRQGKGCGECVLNGFNEAMIEARLLILKVRKTRLCDYVKPGSVKGVKKLFLYLGIYRFKKKLGRHYLEVICFLREAMILFERGRAGLSDKSLDRAVYHETMALEMLLEAYNEACTEAGTARTVQIQIQKGKMKT